MSLNKSGRHFRQPLTMKITRWGRSDHMMYYTSNPLQLNKMMESATSMCDLFRCCEYNIHNRVVVLLKNKVVCMTANDVDYFNALVFFFEKYCM
jgi:hypothetical protein